MKSLKNLFFMKKLSHQGGIKTVLDMNTSTATDYSYRQLFSNTSIDVSKKNFYCSNVIQIKNVNNKPLNFKGLS